MSVLLVFVWGFVRCEYALYYCLGVVRWLFARFVIPGLKVDSELGVFQLSETFYVC